MNPPFISLALTISLVFFSLIVAPAASADPAAASSTDAQKEFVSAPVKFRVQKNIGYNVDLLSPYRNLTSEQFLLSIDGANLRGESLAQIKKRLMGQPGSTVNVEIAYSNGETESLDLVRQAQPEQTDAGLSPLGLCCALKQLGSTKNHPNLLESDATNVDLIAKAYSTDAVQECDAAADSISQCTRTLLQSMVLCQAIGDFDSADQYLNIALDEQKDIGAIQIQSNQLPLYRVIKNLVALGEQKEASLLCDRMLDTSTQYQPGRFDPFSVLEAYSLVPGSEAEKSRLSAAEKLYPVYVAEKTPFTQNYMWFGDYLERLGWNEKALLIYKAQEKRFRRQIRKIPMFPYCQPLAECLYRKARLEALKGDAQDSANDLNAVASYLKETIPPRQYALLDRLPLYFPTPSDVATAQLGLQRAKPIAPSLAPQTSPLCETPGDFDSAGQPVSLDLQFSAAQKCFEATKQSKRKDAEGLANQLLDAYKNQAPMERFAPVRQNLFCTILRVARAFADRRWFDTSDNLLDQLSKATKGKSFHGPALEVADAMIAAEKLYNDAAEGTKSDLLWKTFQLTYHLTDRPTVIVTFPRRDWEWRERLRLLAMGYYYADEPKRAKFFITRALDTDLQKDSVESNPLTSKSSEQFLLFVNSACISAKSEEFASADKFMQQAFSGPYIKDPDSNAAILEAAAIYSRRGHTEQAIAFLEKAVRNSTGDSQTWRCAESDAQINALLAKLLNSVGKTSESVKVREKSIADFPDYVRHSDYALVAESLEKDNKFSDAAKYYEIAAKDRARGCASQPQSAKYLQKAIECATKAKDFDHKTLANLYIKMSGQVPPSSLSESLQLREKALALTDDSDPEKPNMLSINAYLRRAIREQNSSSTEGTTASATSTPSTEELNAANEAARLAVQDNLQDASEYLMRLATLEAQLNKIDLAVQHGRQAIAAYSSKDPKAQTPGQILPGYGLPGALATAGARDKAKLLFNESVKRVKDVKGPTSMAAQAQLAHLFDFYASGKEYAKADEILDEILRTDLGQGVYSVPNHDMIICRMGPQPLESSLEVIGMIEGTAERTVKPNDCTFAMSVLNKLLATERRQFSPEDRRVGLTLVQKARAYSIAGQYSKANEVYDEVLPILKKYEPFMFVLSNINPGYFDVLRKVNKQAEIDKIEDEQLAEQRGRTRQPGPLGGGVR